MTAKRLYLHAGKHKTGSTSFQMFLSDELAALDACGVSVVRELPGPDGRPWPAGNAVLAAHTVLRRSLQERSRVRGELQFPTEDDQADARRRMNAALHALDHDTVVMSCEGFSFVRAAAERAALLELTDGFHLIPVVVIRETEAWLRSMAAQLGKIAPADRPADVRGTVFDLSRDSWHLDHTALFAALGPDTRVLQYEDALARDASVVPSILRAMDLPVERFSLSTAHWVNRAYDDPRPERMPFTTPAQAALRHVARLMKSGDPALARAAFEECRGQLGPVVAATLGADLILMEGDAAAAKAALLNLPRAALSRRGVQLILAEAHYRLGETEEAQRWLDAPGEGGRDERREKAVAAMLLAAGQPSDRAP
ncbi:MAG: hypothetical protein AAGF45_06505 [Pseudomonadota bacterium]